jgi:predicted dehydrogenase
MDRKMAGAGTMADKGAHVIDMARYLVGEIDEVCAKSALFIKNRKVPGTGETKEVTTNDAAVFLAGFENGALGVFELSNMCAGRKNALILEINGSRGSIKFDLERLNELDVYFDGDDAQLKGFRTINVTESSHNYISHWWPSGHLIGWEHTFIHQIYDLIKAIEDDTENESNFYDGLKSQQAIEALDLSDRKHGWVKTSEIGGI